MRKIRGTLNLCVSYVLEFLLASYVDAWMREPSPFYTHKFVPVHASLCRNQLEHAATTLFGFDSEVGFRQR